MDNQFILLLIVASLSFIQSIFGIGLLVFGTPLLLFMKIPFNDALSILLPSSMLISSVQVLQSKTKPTDIQKKMIGYSIIGVLTGLTFLFNDYFNIDLKIFVGIGLLISGILRMLKINPIPMRENLLRQFNLYSFLMGLIHGISNMGGGVLTFLSTTIYFKKNEQRYNIALGYLVFGVVQLSMMVIYRLDNFSFLNIIFIGISALIFGKIGNTVYENTSQFFFDHSMTVLIFIFAFTMLISSLY